MFRKILRWFGLRPSHPAGYLYYARLKTPQGTYYKLGFTTKPTLAERLAYGGLGDERLIEKELLFSSRADAYDVEQTLHDHFRGKRAFKKRFSNNPDMPLAGRGQTELFSHDALGLDEDIYKALPTELSAEERTAYEEQGVGCLLMVIALVLAPFTLGLSLLLLLMGGTFFFGQTATSVAARPHVHTRPVHPPAIQALIEDLKKDCCLANRAVTIGASSSSAPSTRV
jgi:hypothetical protein